MFDYAGCIHFHSSFSYDARTSIASILTSAQSAGLDFAVLTDHFHLDAREQGLETYHAGATGSKVLLIVGEEISPRYNHYLAFNTTRPVVVAKTDVDAQAIINQVAEQGGFGFIAHPDHSGAALVGARAYPWISWDVTGFAGLGIWDLMSDWTSSLQSRLAILKSCWRPAHALTGPRPETLARWDSLTQTQHCVAIGEVDNHGHQRRFLFFSKRVFDFDFAFRTIRTHVMLSEALSGNADADRLRILEALRMGQSYVSLDIWNNPLGFHFEIFDETQRAPMGGTMTRQGAALLEVKIPEPGGHFRIKRNGHVIWEERGRSHVERDVDLPGVYRVEVDQYVSGRWRPWIFSNPIWVK